MGKKRIEIKRIPDPKQRYKAFLKRKRGLIKKTIELSMLCGVNVFLGLINPDTETTSVYQSETNTMNEIIKSLRNNNIKKEFINSSSYSSFLDPHYIKLLNRYSKPEGENNEAPKKRYFQFYSVNEPASLYLKGNVNNDTQISKLVELENQCLDLFPTLHDEKQNQTNSEKTRNTTTEIVNVSSQEKIVQDLQSEYNLESLKDSFLNESIDLSRKLKEQLSVIEEIGSFSNELLKQILEDPHSNQVELYKLLKDYSSSLVFDE